MAKPVCHEPAWCPDTGGDAWGNPFKMAGFATGTNLGGNDNYDTLLPSSAIRNPVDGGLPPGSKFRSYRYDMSYCKPQGDALRPRPSVNLSKPACGQARRLCRRRRESSRR